MAATAAEQVDGDHIDDYLRGDLTEDYFETKEYLNSYCEKMNVSLVYVIRVDTSDYNHFLSVFNAVNNTVDDSKYVPWELGHERETTNEDFRKAYKALYEQKEPYGTIYRTNPGGGLHPHITTLVPVKDSEGSVTALLCIQRPMHELQAARVPYLRNIGISTVLLAAAASLVAAAYFKKQFVVPIRKTSAEATRFAKENTKGEPLGEISRFDEIAKLAASIDMMETDMVNYIDDLTMLCVERK